MKIQLGDKVKDKVTGFVGIAVAETKFLNGCRRFGVQSDRLKDGLPTDASWFDEPQLTIVKSGVVESASQEQRENGGPMSFVPKRSKDPVR